MTLTGPITDLVREQRADRRASVLPSAWVAPATTGVVRWPTRILAREAGQALDLDAWASPVLVMLRGDAPSAERALLDAARAGRRAYAAVPPGWGGTASAGPFASAPRAQVLVRRVAGVPASAILTGAGGVLWLGADADGSAMWRMTLDAAQLASLRTCFLRLFWHEAVDEGWNDGGRLVFRPCAERPADVPEIGSDTAAVRLVRGRRLPEVDAGGMVYWSSSAPPSSRCTRLWTTPSGEHHAALVSARRAGVEVVAGDLGLPLCSVSADRGEILASSDEWTLRVVAGDSQRRDLRTILGSEPTWTFHSDVPLPNIEQLGARSRVWVARAADPAELTPLQEVPVDAVASPSLRACIDAAPALLPEPEPLALTVRWRWTVRAPRCPPGAVDDPLVVAWRKLDQDFASRIAAVRDRLGRLEEQEGLLARTFDALRGAVLGFGGSRRRVRAALDELGAAVPSAAAPERVDHMLVELAEVEREVGEVEAAVGAAEQQARDNAERERQQIEFDAVQSRKRAEVEAQRTELAQKQAELADTEARLGALASPQGEQMSNADRKAAQKKLRDDQERLGKRVARLEQLIAEADAALARPFEYRRSPGRAAPKAGFVPAAPPPSATPRASLDMLPRVGRLVTAGGQRYLAIDRWEDLDAGEAEATRLAARLVANAEER